MIDPITAQACTVISKKEKEVLNDEVE